MQYGGVVDLMKNVLYQYASTGTAVMYMQTTATEWMHELDSETRVMISLT